MKQLSIPTFFVVIEYAYTYYSRQKFNIHFRLYKALVKYWPIFKMAAIVNLYRQMLTGVGLQGHADSMKPSFNFMGKIKSRNTENVCIA